MRFLDGFILKDSQGTPKWVQARSYQNGYYSSRATGAYLIDRYHEIWGNNSLGRLKR